MVFLVENALLVSFNDYTPLILLQPNTGGTKILLRKIRNKLKFYLNRKWFERNLFWFHLYHLIPMQRHETWDTPLNGSQPSLSVLFFMFWNIKGNFMFIVSGIFPHCVMKMYTCESLFNNSSIKKNIIFIKGLAWLKKNGMLQILSLSY